MDDIQQFDAIVVGSGQAGKPLARRLAGSGRHTAIIERGRVGGTCVIAGCSPTKTMIASARVAHLVRRAGDYGVEVGRVSIDLSVVRERKRGIVDAFSADSLESLEEPHGLELIRGEASFSGRHELDVTDDGGVVRRLGAPEIFLNVGLRPTVPPIEGLDQVDWLDSESVMELADVPEHLVVMGGGFIGLEFGQMFRRFGADVTIVEMAPRLAMREDEDVSEAIRDILEEDGIRVLTETKVTGAARGPAGVRLSLDNLAVTEIEGSHLLVAVGRSPVTDALNLEATGLAANEAGYIEVNDRCETKVEGIWALGDVTGSPPFTHISYDDYRIVRDNLLGEGGASRDGRLVPYTAFIDPQLGRVGMTEREAREAGHDVRVAKIPMRHVARAIEMDETRGLMKAVVDAESDRILGAAILGVEGGEVATVLQVAMMGDLPWTALRDTAISHPTLSESLNNLFMTLDD